MASDESQVASVPSATSVFMSGLFFATAPKPSRRKRLPGPNTTTPAAAACSHRTAG
ncbi:MAG: hypothetical protein U1F43_08345 [Myxococcota bacterium]